MGWGLTINGLYLNKVTKGGLLIEKEETENLIKLYETELIAIGAYTGTTYEDGEDTWSLIDHVSRRVPEILEELYQYYTRLMLINHALENPDDVTGE